MALLAVLLALAVRLPTLGLLPLWLDEITTARSLAVSSGALIENRLAAMHSPLFFLLLQALGLEGAAPFWLRLPAALCDAAAAGVMTLMAARSFSQTVALAMALLYAVSPVLVQQAQDARPYGSFFLAEALLIASCAALATHPRLAAASLPATAPPGSRPGSRLLRRLWLGALLGGTLTVALLPLGLFVCAALDLWLVTAALLRRLPWRFVGLWLLQRLLSLLLLAPLFYGWSAHVGTLAAHYWPPPPSWSSLLPVLVISHGGGVEGDPDLLLGAGGNAALTGLLLAFALLGALAGLRARGRRGSTTGLAVALALLVPALLLAVSLVSASLLVGRYAAAATPALLLLAAIGLATLWQRHRAVAAAAGGGLLLLLALQGGDALLPLLKPRYDLVAEVLRQGEQRPLPAVVEPWVTARGLSYAVADDPPLALLDSQQALAHLEAGGVLWVVLRRPFSLEAIGLPALDRRYARCERELRGLRLSIHALDPAGLPAACEALAD